MDLRRVDGPRCFRPLRWQGNVLHTPHGAGAHERGYIFAFSRNRSGVRFPINWARSSQKYGMHGQVDYAADSVSIALRRSEIISPLAYLPHLQFQRKRRTWFHELEQSGVVANAKLVPCRTLCALECISTDRNVLAR